MEYNIINDNYRDFDIFEINKLKPRTYAIPFGSLKKLKATDCLTERYKSDKVRVLSGEWDFKYYEKSSIVPVHFDTDRVQFGKVNVPSTSASRRSSTRSSRATPPRSPARPSSRSPHRGEAGWATRRRTSRRSRPRRRSRRAAASPPPSPRTTSPTGRRRSAESAPRAPAG